MLSIGINGYKFTFPNCIPADIVASHISKPHFTKNLNCMLKGHRLYNKENQHNQQKLTASESHE